MAFTLIEVLVALTIFALAGVALTAAGLNILGTQEVLRRHDPAAPDLALVRDRHILIEDVDREGFDDRALFHLFNAVRQHERTMLITSRLWPAAWPVELADLRSRLRAATVVEIGEPDDDLLAQVIVKLFSDRQVAVEPRVVSYLVARMERSFDAAVRLVVEIDRLALARRARITTAIAAEVLAQDADRQESP